MPRLLPANLRLFRTFGGRCIVARGIMRFSLTRTCWPVDAKRVNLYRACARRVNRVLTIHASKTVMTRSMEDDFVFRKFFAACRLFVLTMQLKTVSCLFTTHVCSDATNCFALIHCSSSHLSLEKKQRNEPLKWDYSSSLWAMSSVWDKIVSFFLDYFILYDVSHEFFSFANITLFVLKKQIKHNTIITYYYYNTSIRQKTIR